ncbi:hypothetical protein DSO57_1014337 [Entomophthora muscae]|uniref:Uncharacterized protein n=1 Tax=Entomophthora muscae TaxID=34485 RepID=A0ACC2T5N4_9FUNG|nr:hypothetical protein DSO57_1014337 [Entomophthora muscae]
MGASIAYPVPQPKLSLSNFVRDFMQSRKQHEQELERARNNPSLNFMTTFMQNLTQFVPRVTGVRIFRDNVVKIFTWETPKNSWGVFFIYVLVCLRPVWLVILPFMIMWFQQFQEYVKEISEVDSGMSSPRERGARCEGHTPEPQSPSYYPIFGNDFMAARETAAKYALNMQFMQNIMGTHVQIHNQNEKKLERI